MGLEKGREKLRQRLMKGQSQTAAAPQETAREPEAPQKVQFSVKWMMLVTLVVAVAAAALGGMRRGGQDRFLFVLLGAAAPLVVLTVVGVAHEVLKRWRR